MTEQKITVRIDSSRPIFIEADPDQFGSIFAHLNDHEQIDVLRSMVKHMKPHRSQWDYIAIALEKDENRDVFNDLSVLFPGTETLVGQIETLRAALEKIATHTGHRPCDCDRCYCGKPEDAAEVAAWDERNAVANIARAALSSPSSPPTE